MKKLLSFVALAAVMTMFSGAANALDVFGFVFKNATTPGDGFNQVVPTKYGSATCSSYFGIVALGDCSVATAMKKGGVRTLSHYDVHRKNILGFQKITVKAYGQ